MSSETNETIADILRGMRETADANERLGFHDLRNLSTDSLRAWADRIEAASKLELSKNCPKNGPEIGQLAPKPDWGVHEALAFANTLANHGWTRDANPDAASSCIYALCRTLSSPGNAAALREALEEMVLWMRRVMYSAWFIDADFSDTAECKSALDKALAALAASARNCDKYRTVKEAAVAFAAEYNSRKDASPFMPVSDFCFSTWLFAARKEARNDE